MACAQLWNSIWPRMSTLNYNILAPRDYVRARLSIVSCWILSTGARRADAVRRHWVLV